MHSTAEELIAAELGLHVGLQVDAAKEAFKTWKNVSISERQRVMFRYQVVNDETFVSCEPACRTEPSLLRTALDSCAHG